MAWNLTEDEKSTMLQQYGDHLDQAKKEREYYRYQCQECKDNFSKLTDPQRMRGTYNSIQLKSTQS